jgi:8-oxo-dGTP diphosphatase
MDETLPQEGTTRIAAYGLVSRFHEILLCRISAHLPEHAGYWTLPGGGIDFGEDPADAMVREVQEETGLVVRPTGVAGIDSIVFPDGAPPAHSLRIIYRTELLGGVIRNEVEGSTDLCAWHSIDSVRSLPIVGLVDCGLRLL